MRFLNLLLSVLGLFLADCGARSGLDTLEASGDIMSVDGATATGGASTVTCRLAGTVVVVTVLSALPTCQCPNNSQCEVIGDSNGCWPTLCEAANYGNRYC